MHVITWADKYLDLQLGKVETHDSRWYSLGVSLKSYELGEPVV